MSAFVQGVNVNSTASGSKAIAITPAAGNLLVAVGYHSGTTAPGTCSDDQAGGTYTLVGSALRGGSADILTYFIRDNLVSAGGVAHTVTHAPGATTGGGVQVYEISGITRVGAAAAKQVAKEDNQTAGGTPAPSFGFACDTNNTTIASMMNAANPATMTPPTSWNERRDTGFNTPTTGMESATRNSGFTGQTVTWGSTSGTDYCSLILELDASAAGATTILVPWAGDYF